MSVLWILQRLKPQHSLLQLGLKRERFEVDFELLPPRSECVATLGERNLNEARTKCNGGPLIVEQGFHGICQYSFTCSADGKCQFAKGYYSGSCPQPVCHRPSESVKEQQNGEHEKYKCNNRPKHVKSGGGQGHRSVLNASQNIKHFIRSAEAE